jgi:hypothetical protein
VEEVASTSHLRLPGVSEVSAELGIAIVQHIAMAAQIGWTRSIVGALSGFVLIKDSMDE